jgi:hypothetical protein
MARNHQGLSRPFANLGDMRTFGFDALQVCCSSCNATRIVDVSVLPDQVLPDWFAPGMRSHECGHDGPIVHPHKLTD